MTKGLIPEEKVRPYPVGRIVLGERSDGVYEVVVEGRCGGVGFRESFGEFTPWELIERLPSLLEEIKEKCNEFKNLIAWLRECGIEVVFEREDSEPSIPIESGDSGEPNE